MVKGMIIAKSAEKIVDIVKVMHKKGISQVPVVEGKQVIGLVTEDEIVPRIGDANVTSLRAKDVMVEAPPIVNEATKISVLNSLIMYYPILIVFRKGEFLGVVTKSDLLSKIV